MENKANSFEALFERAGDYFETRLELLRLKSVDKSSDAISSFASRLAVFFIFSFSVIILSVGLSLWIGEVIGKSYYGFFIVGGAYLIVGFIVYLLRRQLIKSTIANSFIDKVLN
jgi:hypothetical protein